MLKTNVYNYYNQSVLQSQSVKKLGCKYNVKVHNFTHTLLLIRIFLRYLR